MADISREITPENTNQKKESLPWVAIVGNPNCGKTALFNRLTGLHHRVGNYPGITVEKKSGMIKGQKIMLRDYPGTYSLNAKSIDEKIVADMVQSWRDAKNRPLAVIVVLDATNLSRNIYLALQILDWQVPTIIALNMMDEVRKKGLHININLLKERLNARAVIPVSAKYGEGISDITDTISELSENSVMSKVPVRLLEVQRFRELLKPLTNFLETKLDKLNHDPLIEALRLISEKDYIRYMDTVFENEELSDLKNLIKKIKLQLKKQDIPWQSLEQTARFAFIDMYLGNAITESKVEIRSKSEKADLFLTHKVFGPVILLMLLGFIFNAIFTWAQLPMEAISDSIEWLSWRLHLTLADSLIKSLIIDGIVGGVGSVLVFFPQIILLVFFLGILEDSGYMARMAFMMDRFMSKIGLHGRSVLPLLSGFACAIPAVMSARTIENWRDRLITILIVPLMSCSARLPVYTLLIAAFIPAQTIYGIFSMQAVVLMAIYFLGMFTAIFVALIFKKIYPSKKSTTLIMELPPYRMPMAQSLWWQIYERGKSFLTTAGSIILAVSIVLWFLASYPQPEKNAALSASKQIEQSYAGQIGHAIEPLIRPLGFDWKIGVGLISSFAAREVIISTLSTLYNLEREEEQSTSLIEAMRKDRYADGSPVYTPLVALSLMVFFAYAAQCMATFAIIKKETNSWRWPLLMVAYMTGLAYIASLIVYQSGKLLGF